MVDYYTLLEKEASKRNWDEEQVGIFENWRNSVGEVESNNIPTRTQGDSPEGIGRGKYQYENSKGSATNKTATNRLKTFLKKNNFSLDDLPEEDRKILLDKDPDFSLLSEDTQDIIFLADKSEAPEASLNDLVKGKIGFDDAWINWHWKGSKEEAEKKKQQWRNNVMPPEENIPVGIDNVLTPIQTYQIQPGDTLYSISRKLGISVPDLVSSNNITDRNMIQPGVELEY